MSLAHLDQTIELARGEAGALWWAVADCGRRNLTRLLEPAGGLPPLPAGLVVALPALERVARRLKRIDERERGRVGLPRRRPVAFRLKADELVAIMRYVFPQAWSGQGPLGKVQQKSLNLEPWLRFETD